MLAVTHDYSMNDSMEVREMSQLKFVFGFFIIFGFSLLLTFVAQFSSVPYGLFESQNHTLYNESADTGSYSAKDRKKEKASKTSQPVNASLYNSAETKGAQTIRNTAMTSSPLTALTIDNATGKDTKLDKHMKYFHSRLSTTMTSQRYSVLDLLPNLDHKLSPNSPYNIPTVNRMFSILPYSSIWGVKWYPGTDHREYFEMCPFKNCDITHDKANPQKADAVLVHMRSVRSNMRFPRKRTTKQFWISVTRESPYTSAGMQFQRFNDKFNATATYLQKSEIFFAYGYYVNRTQPFDVQSIEVKRKKLVAWFVSHCNAPNLRDQFTKKLQVFMN